MGLQDCSVYSRRAERVERSEQGPRRPTLLKGGGGGVGTAMASGMEGLKGRARPRTRDSKTALLHWRNAVRIPLH